MIYTIEDLTEGKCAVKNDGTLEELKRVLDKASDDGLTSGTFRYYYKEDSEKSWTLDDTTSLPTQSVKIFIKELDRVKEEIAWSPEVGEDVLVWDDDEKIINVRPYLGTMPRAEYPIAAVADGDIIKFRKTNEPVATFLWKNMKQIPVDEPKPIKEVTMADIAAKFGEEVKIVKE